MRVMIDICYDGSIYEGFAPQSHNRTITYKIEETLKKLYKQPVLIYATSRTDSGVCANSQFVVYDQPFVIEPAQIVKALNANFPPQIYCKRAIEVADGYMPRHDVTSKSYIYNIVKSYNPIFRHVEYHVRKPLDVELMNNACQYLIGTHDFSSFCSANSSVTNKIRTINELSVKLENQTIVVRINGDGFLYNMVRIIVGTLIVIGIGNCPPEYMAEILESKDRRSAFATAPACGLILDKIYLKEYDENWGF